MGSREVFMVTAIAILLWTVKEKETGTIERARTRREDTIEI